MKEGQVAYQIHWHALGNLYGKHLSFKSIQVNPHHTHMHALRAAV